LFHGQAVPGNLMPGKHVDALLQLDPAATFVCRRPHRGWSGKTNGAGLRSLTQLRQAARADTHQQEAARRSNRTCLPWTWTAPRFDEQYGEFQPQFLQFARATGRWSVPERGNSEFLDRCIRGGSGWWRPLSPARSSWCRRGRIPGAVRQESGPWRSGSNWVMLCFQDLLRWFRTAIAVESPCVATDVVQC
jgi:hypothetical protein